MNSPKYDQYDLKLLFFFQKLTLGLCNSLDKISFGLFPNLRVFLDLIAE